MVVASPNGEEQNPAYRASHFHLPIPSPLHSKSWRNWGISRGHFGQKARPIQLGRAYSNCGQVAGSLAHSHNPLTKHEQWFKVVLRDADASRLRTFRLDRVDPSPFIGFFAAPEAKASPANPFAT